GGTVDGCFEFCESLMELRDRKPIVCFVNGQGTSAAQAIAASCSASYAFRTATVGSIAICMILATYRAPDDVAGFTVIQTGEDKGPCSEYIAPTEGQLEAMRDLARSSHKAFVECVLAGRSMRVSRRNIEALKGRAIQADLAVALGLFDGLARYDEVLNSASATRVAVA
ncbi:MAG: S49 family peptidase, partial [Planctomycetota bacterium]|nr:S49 family peptidase [Planctomycetota bacterium]